MTRIAEGDEDAAAVLINQSHTFKDLILPIDSAEKRLFDTIDGTRSIGEIISASAKSGSRRKHRERARTLFERLWQYDQVVFDASDGSNHGRGNRSHSAGHIHAVVTRAGSKRVDPVT